jgi:hypothetical protein
MVGRISGSVCSFAIFCAVSVNGLTLAADEPAGNEKPQAIIHITDSAQSIVERSVKAFGGADKLNRWSTGKITWKPKSEAMSARVGGEVTIEDVFQLPGHSKRITRVSVNGREESIIWVLNDGKGWRKRSDGGGTVEITNDATKQKFHVLANFFLITSLLEKGVTMTVSGEEKVAGRPVILVKVESDKLGKAEYCFDTATALLVKSKKTGPNPFTNEQAVLESLMSDYKDVEGGKVPMHISAFAGGKAILEVAITKVEFHDKIDPAEFAKP